LVRIKPSWVITEPVPTPWAWGVVTATNTTEGLTAFTTFLMSTSRFPVGPSVVELPEVALVVASGVVVTTAAWGLAAGLVVVAVIAGAVAGAVVAVIEVEAVVKEVELEVVATSVV